MTPDQSTLVYPGGPTRCLFSYSSEYAFQVIPGDRDKLVIYFQGGGACWDQMSTVGPYGPLCSVSAHEEPLNGGILDRRSWKNPFQNYTVVVVLYCSGDSHIGNVTRSYSDPMGARVEQRGYYNTKAAVAWAIENMGADLQSLVVTGVSAGALATQMWAAKLLSDLRYSRAAVIADSYVGVLPNGTQAKLMRGLGLCDGTLVKDVFPIDPALQPRCDDGNALLQNVFSGAMKRFPGVAFAHITSTYDVVQIGYYNAIALSYGVPSRLDERSFQVESSLVLAGFNRSPNFVAYLVASPEHCFLSSPVLYTSRPSGVNKVIDGNPFAGPLLIDWLADFPPAHGAAVRSECFGVRANFSSWGNGRFWCDWNLARKVFVAP